MRSVAAGRCAESGCARPVAVAVAPHLEAGAELGAGAILVAVVAVELLLLSGDKCTSFAMCGALLTVDLCPVGRLATRWA